MNAHYRLARSFVAFSLFLPVFLASTSAAFAQSTARQRPVSRDASLINPPDTVADWECHWNDDFDPECWSCSYHEDDIAICDILVYKPGEGWTPKLEQTDSRGFSIR